MASWQTARWSPASIVQGGTRLMALVPADGAYIEANFKETQLADLHAGQKAEITIDAFGRRSVRRPVS